MEPIQERYSTLRQRLHWALAGLLVLQVCAIALFKSMSSLELGAVVLNVHFGLGVLVLIVAIVRLALAFHGGVAPAPVGRRLQHRVARAVHLGLIGVVAAMAALGVATAWARGNAVPIFFLFSIAPPFEASPDLSDRLMLGHKVLGYALLGLVGFHVAAVIYHWRVHGRNVLKRMLPLERLTLFRNQAPIWAQLAGAFAALACAGVLVGVSATDVMGRMAAQGEAVYDHSFLSLAHARAAQAQIKDLLILSGRENNQSPLVEERRQGAMSDLAMVIERAPVSSAGDASRQAMSQLEGMHALNPALLRSIDADLDELTLSLTGASFAARSRLSEEAARLHDILMLIFAPALLLAGLAALLIGANITGLIGKLRRMVQAIETSDPDEKIEVVGEGELAGLMRDALACRDAFAAKRAEAELRRALLDSQAAMRLLFDNAEQGFLTVDSDLAIDAQCSAAVEEILGEPPAGKCIVDELCGDGDGEPAKVMTATMQSIFADASDFARELKLELLPREFERRGKFIRASYKFLAESGKLMLILTDVTETTLLAGEVDRERKRLEMIVLAFTEGEAFAALVEDYRKFLQTELKELVTCIDEDGVRGAFYRRLHTFKGLLAQFAFPRSPVSIHDVETRLTANAMFSAESASELLGLDRLDAAFEEDLASVCDLLGPGFDSSGGRVIVAQQQVRAMEQLARAALVGATGAASRPLRLLLQTLAGLAALNAKAALGLHSRGAPALAMRLDKELEPVIVEGDDVALPPDRYGEFFRSLVHVFRNAVDHGIEAPELRVCAGKARAGSIRCVVRDDADVLKIYIADDGAGVDRRLLERKLAAMGETRAVVERLSLSELVFREGLSSRDAAGQVSGRGVGLSAVKAELDRLGGSVSVETELGIGTGFTFTLQHQGKMDSDDGGVKLERMAL